MSAASVAFRLARRGAALSLRHALLIVLIIALPVAGFSAFILQFQSQIPTVHETVTNELGHTQTRLTVLRSPDPTARQQALDAQDLSGGIDEQGNPKHPDSGTLVDPRTVLSAGTRVLTVADSTAQVQSVNGVVTLPVTLGETADPAFHGRFDVVSGRAPRGPNELTATRAALDRLGVHVGDQVRLVSPVTTSFTIVGVLADHRYPSSRDTLFLTADAYDGTITAPGLQSVTFYLPDTNVTWAQSARFNHEGITVWSRALMSHFGAPQNVWSLNVGLYVTYFGMIAALCAFIIALLAGSAFSIGARARQRALAVVAATGASRALLFGLMVSTGALIGAIAGAVGVGLGIAVGAAWIAVTDDGTIQHYAGFHLLWWEQLIVFAYAVLVGVIAAATPAVGASRADTVAALRGTRRPPVVSRRRPVVGVIMVIAGAALSIACGLAMSFIQRAPADASNPTWFEQHAAALTAAAGYGLASGIVLAQLGLLLCAGLVVRLTARLIGRTGVAARLAGRDLSRNHARTVPAIGAIMATSFLAVFASGLLLSQSVTGVANYMYSLEPGQLFIPAVSPNGKPIDAAKAISTISGSGNVRLATTIDGAALPPESGPPDDATLYANAVVSATRACPAGHDHQPDISYNAEDQRCRDPHANGVTYSTMIPSLVVGDAHTLATILGHSPSAAAKQELANGGALGLHEQLVADGELTIGWNAIIDFGIPGNTAAAAHKESTVGAVYEKTSHEVDVLAVLSPSAATRAGIRAVQMGALVQFKNGATQNQLDTVNGALQRLSGDSSASAQYEPGPQEGSQQALVWAALAASAFLALCAAGVALALARSDGRRDVEVLDSVGAAPGIRRRYAAWQAIVITGVGMLLGALTGTIGAFAIAGTSTTDVFAMPYVPIVIAIAGTTIAIAAVSWLSAGRARASTFRSAIA